MAPSTSSRKRPALSSGRQTSIASFFSPSSASNCCPSSISTTNTAANTSSSVAWGNNPHESSGDIKYGLLSVGMRIRQAVPQGLKTGTYKSTKFGVVPPNQEKALSKLKGNNNKREFQEDPEVETPTQTERPAGKISVPKSLSRTFHAAVARDSGADTRMGDQCKEDDFEEALFLKPVE